MGRKSKLLAKAFDEASTLPEKDQNALAAAILREVASERRWDSLMEDSQDELAALADEALEERRAGQTKPLSHEHE